MVLWDGEELKRRYDCLLRIFALNRMESIVLYAADNFNCAQVPISDPSPIEINNSTVISITLAVFPRSKYLRVQVR